MKNVSIHISRSLWTPDIPERANVAWNFDLWFRRRELKQKVTSVFLNYWHFNSTQSSVKGEIKRVKYKVLIASFFYITDKANCKLNRLTFFLFIQCQYIINDVFLLRFHSKLNCEISEFLIELKWGEYFARDLSWRVHWQFLVSKFFVIHQTTQLPHRCRLLRNRISQVSFFIPFAAAVEGFEFDLTFLIASRSFASTGRFSILRHPALFDRVSNHDGWRSK